MIFNRVNRDTVEPLAICCAFLHDMNWKGVKVGQRPGTREPNWLPQGDDILRPMSRFGNLVEELFAFPAQLRNEIIEYGTSPRVLDPPVSYVKFKDYFLASLGFRFQHIQVTGDQLLAVFLTANKDNGKGRIRLESFRRYLKIDMGCDDDAIAKIIDQYFPAYCGHEHFRGFNTVPDRFLKKGP